MDARSNSGVATFHSLDDFRKRVHDTFFPVDFRLKDRGGDDFFSRFETDRLGSLEVTRAFVRERSFGHRGRDLCDGNEPDQFVLNVVRSGLVREAQFGRQVETAPGFMSLFASRSPFDVEQLTATRAIYIRIPGAPLRAAIGIPEDYCAIQFDLRSGLGAIFYEFLAAAWREKERLTEQERHSVSTKLIDMFASVCATAAQRPRAPARDASALIVDRAVRFIEANLGDPQLNPDRVAKALRISCSHLHAAARGKGPTIGQTILIRRLERCRELLADPRLAQRRVTEIAFDCGFNHAAHFSRVFKSQFGLSPRAFRKQQAVTSVTSGG